MPDIIVTGLPRAGSAIVAALIDTIPNAISFNTPPGQLAQAQNPLLEALPYCKWLLGDFMWARRVLMDGEPVADIRAPDGNPLLDGLYDPRQTWKDIVSEDGLESIKEPHLVAFTRPDLSADFTLAMRHHTLYTALLPTLVPFNHFKIIAIIRHPLDVLNSWRSLPQPMIRRGRPHGIKRFWPQALAIMEAKAEAADRFVQLYDAFIQRYHESREHIHILKYEDIVDDPSLISRALGTTEIPAGARWIEKRPRVRNAAEDNIFRERFRKYGVFTKLYYPDI